MWALVNLRQGRTTSQPASADLLIDFIREVLEE